MAWIDDARKQLSYGRLELCESGHPNHRRHVVPVRYPFLGQREMWVYDGFHYQGTHGYCTGDDDISRTVMTTGMWEKGQTPVIAEILHEAQPGLVLDFGAHIGWYTLMAADMGHDVLAIEACTENLETLGASIAIQRPSGQIVMARGWIDENTPTLEGDSPPIRLVKIDLEGADLHAVRVVNKLLSQKLIDNVFVEISPVFNDSYPIVIDMMMRGYGFEGEIISEEVPRSVTYRQAIDELGKTPQFDMLFRLER